MFDSETRERTGNLASNVENALDLVFAKALHDCCSGQEFRKGECCLDIVVVEYKVC